MPYIDSFKREHYKEALEELTATLDNQKWPEGHVNYVIFSILLAWWKSESRYHTIARIMGTLSCVAQEFYRRVAGPYEDCAIEMNGDLEDM